MPTRVKPMSALSLGLDNRAAEKKRKPLDTSDEINIVGKIIVITGANSGIGACAALEFAKRGAKLIMPCRDMKKAQVVIDDIKLHVPSADIHLLELDLEDLSSVRRAASEIRNNFDHINILINNAGFYSPDKVLRKTLNGFESHMGTNHLGPFLFTMLLLDLVKKVAPSRILFTSSMGHQSAMLDIDDIMCEKSGAFGLRNFGPYFNSKLANMYCTYSLGRRLEGTGVHTYALCPGHVKSGFMRNDKSCLYAWLGPLLNLNTITSEQGAETILYCALSNKCANETGLMYRYNGVWENAMEKAVDHEIAEIFWRKSEILVGLSQN